MAGRHHYTLSRVEVMFYPVNCYSSHPVKAGHKSVSARGMGADLLVFIKGKQGYADRSVLGNGLAYDLPFLICDLVFQGKDFRLGNVLIGPFMMIFS